MYIKLLYTAAHIMMYPVFSLITILQNIGSSWNFYTIFLDPDAIFSSHTMFINASTKEFTLVNNAIPSYDIAFEHLLYYRLAPPIL